MENKITAEGIIHEALHYKEKMYGSNYPVQVFPHQIQDIIYSTGECLNYSIDYIAASLCFVLPVGIGNTHVVKLKEGWTERAILYTALIGRPGVSKSHPLSLPLILCLNKTRKMPSGSRKNSKSSTSYFLSVRKNGKNKVSVKFHGSQSSKVCSFRYYTGMSGIYSRE